MGTGTIERADTGSSTTGPASAAAPVPVRRWLHSHRASLGWLTPLVLVAAAVHAWGIDRIPQRIDDEGTYVAQAFAVLRFGELTHYTYFYDHPPLGWLQLAGWAQVTGAFARYSEAVLVGREFMLVATLVSVVLLWLLARRLGFSRPAAAVAVALFALSPLAVQFHRTVYLDNIATPWLLGAFLLTVAPRRQLLAHAAAAAAFGVAVLTKETFLLFMPFLAWQMWRGADRSTRRYTLSVAAAVLVLVGSSYVLLAAVKGELAPGSDNTSLWEGIGFQLLERSDSGSLFDPDSLGRVTAGSWWALDPVFILASPVAALVALRDRRLWPPAAALLFHVAFALRPGYLPVPYVVALIPLGALLIPGAVEACVRAARARPGTVRRRVGQVVTAAVSLAVVAAAAPLWTVQLRGLLLADLDAPMSRAQAWVEQNIGRDARLVVDDAMWVDMVRAGFDRDDVVWYYKADTDPEVAGRAPGGWSDYDYVISTNSMRNFPDDFPVVAQAIENSTVVASFGSGDTAVEVLRVESAGAQAGRAQRAVDGSARAAAGAEIAENPALTLSAPVRSLAVGGRVDGRALVVLTGATAAVGPLTVADAPIVPGEENTELPRRQVVVAGGDGALAEALRDYLENRSGDLGPAAVEPTAGGLLLTWPPTGPVDVLPTGTP